MANLSFTFSVNPITHRHIVDWLARQENASAAIRDVLDDHIRGEVRVADTLAELSASLAAVRSDVAMLRRQGVRVRVDDAHLPGPSEPKDEPEAATAALDNLGVD